MSQAYFTRVRDAAQHEVLLRIRGTQSTLKPINQKGANDA
jgi:hypothetical protein